ncbi:testis-expressed protein 22 [Acomys russatus]|uniref:testis-expressed protein 22 n=1 Tax=Acomys russatus TaxID=60746 RepID=UPI0021E21D22|nr:testis-expressed protein 22 [Acomys russatus]
MDSRQQFPQRKMLQWQLAQEQKQRSPSRGPSEASSQPDTKSNPQEDLQTQDWVCEPQEHRHPGSRWQVSIDAHRRLAMLHAQERTHTARAPSRDPPGQQTASSPPAWPAPTSPCQDPETMVRSLQDIQQIVVKLMSEGIDKDVLLPHPLKSTKYPNVFQDSPEHAPV